MFNRIAKSSIALAAAAVVGASIGFSTPAAAQSNQQQYQQTQPGNQMNKSRALRFVQTGVRDPQINNLVAFTFLMPAGWKNELQLVWEHDFAHLVSAAGNVYDPQTGAGYSCYPLRNYVWSNNGLGMMQPGQNYMGAEIAQAPRDIAEFVQNYVIPRYARHLQNARMVGGENLDKDGKIARQAADEGARLGMQSAVQTGRIRFEFQYNGQAWEEDVYVTLGWSVANGYIQWSPSVCASVRAPKGQLDALTPTIISMILSVNPNPDWYAGVEYVKSLFSNRQYQAIKDAGELSRRIAQNSEEIRQMFSESYYKAQASRERTNESMSAAIRGTGLYSGSDGSSVVLPSSHQYVWKGSDGTYYLTDNPNFDPNRPGATVTQGDLTNDPNNLDLNRNVQWQQLRQR